MARKIFGETFRVFDARPFAPIGGVRLKALPFFIAIGLIVAFANSGAAQTPAAIERELVNHAKRIKQLGAERSVESAVRLDDENNALRAKLVKYGKLASTLKHPFNELKKHIFVATSKDGKFRIYSWDTETGGTMHFFENVYQYQGPGAKIFARAAVMDEEDAGGFFTDIFQVPSKRGPIYIGRATSILSTRSSYEEVCLFRIEGVKLNDRVRLFKTKAGMQDHIGFEYDFFSVADRKERPVKLIEFDERTSTVKIPVIIADDARDGSGRVTKRFIKYRFDGTNFVNVR